MCLPSSIRRAIIIRLADGSDGLAISGEYIWDILPCLGRTPTPYEAPMPTGPVIVCILSWVLGVILPPARDPETRGLRLPLIHRVSPNTAVFCFCLCIKESRTWSAWKGIHIRTEFTFCGGGGSRDDVPALVSVSHTCLYVEKALAFRSWGGGHGLVPWAVMCVWHQREGNGRGDGLVGPLGCQSGGSISSSNNRTSIGRGCVVSNRP